MTQALVEQELAEANTYLLQFHKAFSFHTLFLGGSTVCGAVGIPLLVLQIWLTGLGSFGRAAFLGLVLVTIGFSIAFAWRRQCDRLFHKIQLRALKLQRAGFIVYKKPVFLKTILAASMEPLSEGATRLNFENLSADELHDLFD